MEKRKHWKWWSHFTNIDALLYLVLGKLINLPCETYSNLKKLFVLNKKGLKKRHS